MKTIYLNSKQVLRRDCSTCQHCRPWINDAEWSHRECALSGRFILDTHYPSMFCDENFHAWQPKSPKTFWAKLKELFQ